MSGPRLAPLRLARRRCPAPGRSSSQSGRWQSAASCSASPLLAAPDYGSAQQSTAPAEKSAGRRSFVVVQKIINVERLESSSRHAVASDGSQTDSPDTLRLLPLSSRVPGLSRPANRAAEQADQLVRIIFQSRSYSPRQRSLPWRGTNSSNPSPSSGESVANSVFAKAGPRASPLPGGAVGRDLQVEQHRAEGPVVSLLGD